MEGIDKVIAVSDDMRRRKGGRGLEPIRRYEGRERRIGVGAQAPVSIEDQSVKQKREVDAAEAIGLHRDHPVIEIDIVGVQGAQTVETHLEFTRVDQRV